MGCPSCNEHTVCGCNSCKGRDTDGKYDEFRQIFMKSEDGECMIKCPHCGYTLKAEIWEGIEMDKAWEEKMEEDRKKAFLIRGETLGKKLGIT